MTAPADGANAVPAAAAGSAATENRAEVHMDILQAILDQKRSEETGPASQRLRRELERRVRQRAVELAAELVEHGYRRDEAAQRLGLSERTLRHWEHDLRRPQGGAILLGRPQADSGAEQRQAAFHWINQVGPGVGVPSLRVRFPDMARSELSELLHNCRDLWRAQHPRLLHVLRWQRPGTVWAIDFAEPPFPIDGLCPYLLAVRDLASGRQLLWRPVRAATADVVIAELTPLFIAYGEKPSMPCAIGPRAWRFVAHCRTLSFGASKCRATASWPLTLLPDRV